METRQPGAIPCANCGHPWIIHHGYGTARCSAMHSGCGCDHFYQPEPDEIATSAQAPPMARTTDQ